MKTKKINLPDRYRHVYLKTEIEGKDIFAAARELKLTLDEIRVRRSKAKQLIRTNTANQ